MLQRISSDVMGVIVNLLSVRDTASLRLVVRDLTWRSHHVVSFAHARLASGLVSRRKLSDCCIAGCGIRVVEHVFMHNFEIPFLCYCERHMAHVVCESDVDFCVFFRSPKKTER